MYSYTVSVLDPGGGGGGAIANPEFLTLIDQIFCINYFYVVVTLYIIYIQSIIFKIKCKLYNFSAYFWKPIVCVYPNF